MGKVGAGKRAIIDSLLRFVELHRTAGGKIFIDETDIAGLGLHSLRRELFFIPEHPTLLKGTL